MQAHELYRSRGVRTRALVLAALFLLGAGLLINVDAPQVDAAPRYPQDALAVDGWRTSEPSVEGRPGVAFLTREYQRNADSTRASLTLTTSAQAKLVYRAGADVPLLGNGYTVETLPSSGERSVVIARRGSEAWLQVATFGERRGTFGNGAGAWGLAVFDTVLGRSNDYYLARVVVPHTGADSEITAAQLADTLFPRLSAFYAS
jgi:hypothetical protein